MQPELVFCAESDTDDIPLADNQILVRIMDRDMLVIQSFLELGDDDEAYEILAQYVPQYGTA